MDKKERIKYFNAVAAERDAWKRKNRYYYQALERYCSFAIPEGCSVLEIGCGTGDLLAAVKPSRGVGIDFSEEMIKIAKGKYPHLTFQIADAEDLRIKEKFDYIIMSDLIGHLSDVQGAFQQLRKVTRPDSRVVITYFNYFWGPILRFGEKIGLKMPQNIQNWLSLADIENLLFLSDYGVIKKSYNLLLPKYVPLISTFLNRYVSKLPILRKLCLIKVLVARPIHGVREEKKDYTCSIVIPCRNERNNIKEAILRAPEMGRHTEIIFVDGDSNDGTVEEIEKMIAKYKNKDIKLIHQGNAVGKGDAVRKGFAAANGDILMILDADLTVPPEDLPKFYQAMVEGKGEFINGSRLVYPMEKEAMRFLNMLGNKFFSLMFTWLLEQRFKDTLCGTKALFKKDYMRIAEGRSYFGDFDPFGDFDLIFGASKLNLKIIEIPVAYKERIYGSTNIQRFKHGWLLARMCCIAFKKLKLN